MLKTRMNTLNMRMNLMNTLNIDMNMFNMSKNSDRVSHDPLPLVGKILRVKSPVNMFVLKMRVPRQRVW
ncbi:unnamed protein product [Prunus armeniaca]